ncbi:MAG: LysR family transcriptional regulator [Dechloromonas sp.]|nr:MAG: LysR family transcriptional regulator [Dechloromonas sp.]
MPLRHLDLDALRAFVAIVEQGGFSSAAERLGRTQSAVSLQIKRLEQTLGQTLLHRVQGRVDGPTAEGGALLAYARQMLRLNDEACATLARNAEAGSLRIGLPEELMEHVFPTAMTLFRVRYPRLRLSVQAEASLLVRAALAEGRLDVAIYKDCADGDQAGVELLRDEPLCWVAGEAYRDTLLADDGVLPLALFGENCVFRMAATAALARAGIAWKIYYAGSSTTGLRHALRHGLGLGVLPRGLLGDGLLAVNACGGSALPPLPRSRLVAAYAGGSGVPAARCLVGAFADSLHRPAPASLHSLSATLATTAR